MRALTLGRHSELRAARSSPPRNGLLIVPADRSELRRGELAQVEIIDPSFWQVWGAVHREEHAATLGSSPHQALFGKSALPISPNINNNETSQAT